MDRFSEAETRFLECLARCKGICEFQSYTEEKNTAVLDTTDILRASVVLCVSAYDFLVHELFRIEVIARYQTGRNIKRFSLPFRITIANSSEIEGLIDAHVREANSYKSFVDPGKFSEAFGCFIEAPWDKIAKDLNCNAPDLKTRIRAIYRWRNRIAHEADINPVYAGVEFFPILKDDVIQAINDIEVVGMACIEVLRNA